MSLSSNPDVECNPCYRLLKENYPEKLELAESNCLILCLPRVDSIKQDVILEEDFFDAHILQPQPEEEEWLRSGTNPDLNLIAEREDSNHGRTNKSSLHIKLLSAPNYQPSFKKGLHRVRVLQSFTLINQNFQQFVMYVLDRPLIPKYTRAKLNKELSSASSSGSKTSVTTSSGFSSEAPPSTVSTRISSSIQSNGRPYSTEERRVSVCSTHGSGFLRTFEGPGANLGARRKTRKPATTQSGEGNSRQGSADSGIEEENPPDSKFLLPPRITSYGESECYLMSLPRCDQFVNHLVRVLRPMLDELKFTQRHAKDEMHRFAPKLHRLAQELVIAFPRSASLVNNSPRFQEFLRLAVENVVMRFVHDRIFPVICHLSRNEDCDLMVCANYLNETKFSPDQLGLPEDYCVPMLAAVVELASLDFRTTPLDRLTCIYDTVEQIKVHVREAMEEARSDQETFDKNSLTDHDLVLLLANVIVHARPLHLMSTLNYADLFAWSVPIDMIEIVSLMSSAADFVRNIQPKKLLPASGKLKREVSMEEIIQLTDEVQQNYDRQGNRLEPLRSALDLHREKFAHRLEKNSADRTQRQEEAWARLDRCATPTTMRQQQQARVKKGLLATIHTKLICSTDPVEKMESSKK